MDDALASRLLCDAPSPTYLLEALHDAQELFGGWLSRPTVEQIATYLEAAGGRRLRRDRVLRDVSGRAGGGNRSASARMGRVRWPAQTSSRRDSAGGSASDPAKPHLTAR